MQPKPYEKLKIEMVGIVSADTLLAASAVGAAAIQSSGQSVVYEDFATDTGFTLDWGTSFE